MTTANDEQPLDAELRGRYASLQRSTDGPHPTEDDWVRLAEGTLDETSRVRLADHVTACARCAEVFRAVDHVRQGARALGVETPSQATGRFGGVSRGWYGLALAATLVLAVAGAVRWSGRGAVEEPESVIEGGTVAQRLSSRDERLGGLGCLGEGGRGRHHDQPRGRDEPAGPPAAPRP